MQDTICGYLITLNEDDDDVMTEAHAFKTRGKANDFLEEITYGNIDEENTCMYYGTVVSTKFIPDNFKGCSPYILVRHPLRDIMSVVTNEVHFNKEKSCPMSVMQTIQNILNSNSSFPNDDTTISEFSEKKKITIDDIFIFFGNKIIPVFHIAESTIDEEFEDRLETLSGHIEQCTEFFEFKGK